MCGNLIEIPQKAFLTRGSPLFTRGPPSRRSDQKKTCGAIPRPFFTDQLRKLAMNVEGISLAGGTADAPSIGKGSAIVLRNRASVDEDEKW